MQFYKVSGGSIEVFGGFKRLLFGLRSVSDGLLVNFGGLSTDSRKVRRIGLKFGFRQFQEDCRIAGVRKVSERSLEV